MLTFHLFRNEHDADMVEWSDAPQVGGQEPHRLRAGNSLLALAWGLREVVEVPTNGHLVPHAHIEVPEKEQEQDQLNNLLHREVVEQPTTPQALRL